MPGGLSLSHSQGDGPADFMLASLHENYNCMCLNTAVPELLSCPLSAQQPSLFLVVKTDTLKSLDDK